MLQITITTLLAIIGFALVCYWALRLAGFCAQSLSNRRALGRSREALLRNVAQQVCDLGSEMREMFSEGDERLAALQTEQEKTADLLKMAIKAACTADHLIVDAIENIRKACHAHLQATMLHNEDLRIGRNRLDGLDEIVNALDVEVFGVQEAQTEPSEPLTGDAQSAVADATGSPYAREQYEPGAAFGSQSEGGSPSYQFPTPDIAFERAAS